MARPGRTTPTSIRRAAPDDASDEQGDGRRRRRRGGRRRRKSGGTATTSSGDPADDPATTPVTTPTTTPVGGRQPPDQTPRAATSGNRGDSRTATVAASPHDDDGDEGGSPQPPSSAQASRRRGGRRRRRRPREHRHPGPQGSQRRGRDHRALRLHPPRGQEAASPRGPRGRPSPCADRQRGRVPGPPRGGRPGDGHPPARGPHPDRRARGQGARRALRRPGVADLADRQRLPRQGAERAALDGGGLHRHRQGPQRRALRRRGQLGCARRRQRCRARSSRCSSPASPCWSRSPRTRSATRAPG